MAINARFNADFGQFFDAVQRAEVSLRGFDAEARSVEKSLNRMVDQFTGRRVVQEAQLMTEAVRRIGSPARLTATELQRVGAVAEEAIEKFRRMGQQAPPHMIRLADAAKRARTNTDSLRQTFSQFDGALASVGLNLGPIPRGVDDIASAAGKTTAEVGKLATAGLAAGAAFAGWNVGRWIADLTNSDQIIGDFTAKLLGWGDAAGEKAAAAADVLARATRNAGRPITDMAEAMRINAKAAEEMIAANKKAGDEAQRLATIEQSNLQKTIALYHDAARAQQERFEKEQAEWDEMMATRREGERDAERQKQDTAARDEQYMQEHLQALKDVQEADIQRLQTEVAIREETKRTTWELRQQRLEAEAIARSQGSTVEYDLSTPEGMERFRRQNPGATVNAPTDYFQSHSLADAIREGYVKFAYAGQQGGYAASGLGGGGVGTPFGGGFAGAPWTGGSGRNAPVQVNVNINGGYFDQQATESVSSAVNKGVGKKMSMVTTGWG